MHAFLSNLNMQTLSLLAIVSGLVIVCMGMWYIWSAQQQIQTDVLFLQAQYAQLTGKGVSKAAAATASTGASENTLTRALAAEDSRFPEQHAVGGGGDGQGICASGGAVCAFPTDTAEPSVRHRSDIALQATSPSAAQDGAESDTSSDSASDYEDDDEEDVADEDADEATTTLGGDEDAHVVAAVNEVGAGVQAPDAEVAASAETTNIVNSLLSNMVTETIDQIMPASSAVSFLSVDASAMGNLMGSADVASVVMGAVAAPTAAAADVVADVVVEDVEEGSGSEAEEHASEAVEAAEVGDVAASADTGVTAAAEDIASTTSSVPENLFDCQGDPKLLSETLHAKTVAELKQLCGTCDVGIRKGRTFKRKAELIDDLVQKVCG